MREFRVRPRLLQRPDGAEIHWEEQGEGPTVVLTHHTLWSYPAIYGDLIADLARDHRVIVYDPRGCGRSSRRGPYDADTDAGDLEAVAEAAGGAAVAIAVGDGVNRACRVAAIVPIWSAPSSRSCPARPRCCPGSS